MRLANSIIAALAYIVALVHVVLGSVMLATSGYLPIVKYLAMALGTLVMIHIVLCVIITVRSSVKAKPLKYPKSNAALWVRRISGIVVICIVFVHGSSFGRVVDGSFVVTPWNWGLLGISLLFAIALAAHMITAARPLCISLGISIPDAAIRAIQSIVVLACLFAVIAFSLYAKGWL